MPADFDNVTGGPANFTLTGQTIGHTSGGISATISPQNRPVNVDQFGVGECNIRHTGDEVRVTVPFAEWTAATVKEVYAPGRDQTASSGSDGAYLGIGRSSGFIYPTKAAQIVPFLSADAAKKLHFFRVTPVGEFEIAHNADDDRVFETEFAALIDENQTDGQLIGRIQVAAGA